MNAHDPVLGVTVLVVAHPFAVRSLFGIFVGRNETFECNLSLGWNRQTGQLALNHLNRTAAHASRPIHLAFTKPQPLHAGGQEQQWISSHHCDNGARLVSPHIFFLDDPTVVRRSGANANAVPIEHLIAISAGIDDAGIGIAHDIDACRPDEPAAVAGMPYRRRKAIQVNFTVAKDIFLNRPSLDHHRWNRRKTFEQLPPKLQQNFMRCFCWIQAQGERLPFARTHAVDQNPVAWFEIRNFIEENTRALVRVVQYLSNGADVFLRTRAADAFQLAERINQLKPISQITPLWSGGLGFSLLGHLFASSQVSQVPFRKRAHIIAGIHPFLYIRRNPRRSWELTRG